MDARPAGTHLPDHDVLLCEAAQRAEQRVAEHRDDHDTLGPVLQQLAGVHQLELNIRDGVRGLGVGLQPVEDVVLVEPAQHQR